MHSILTKRRRRRHLALITVVVLASSILSALPGWACDADADCGSGGTCIKREKRARGVCYGRSEALPAAAAPHRDNALAPAPRPVEGVRRERAMEFFGDPEQVVKDQFPGKSVGPVCMLNQDCPTGRMRDRGL
jgi:hypothetical protein